MAVSQSWVLTHHSEIGHRLTAQQPQHNVTSVFVFWIVGRHERFGGIHSFHLQGWRRQYVSPKRWYLPTSLHDVPTQETNTGVFTAVRTSRLKFIHTASTQFWFFKDSELKQFYVISQRCNSIWHGPSREADVNSDDKTFISCKHFSLQAYEKSLKNQYLEIYSIA
jgi:hypothetical protein